MSSTLETVKQPMQNQPQTTVNKKGMDLAASWYIAMPSKDLGKKPKTIELFGQPLVAWRNQNGHPVIMERYCSHMGASLAIGKVVDGCIQCPFHHWRYDGSGQCVSIPEIEHIPPKAYQAIYVTAERYGYIWVWYGSQNPLFPLPDFPLGEDQRHNYMFLRFAYDTKTSVLRVNENVFDYYHVFTLHKQKASGPIRVTLLDDPHSAPQSNLSIQQEGWFGALEEFSSEAQALKLGGLNAQTLMTRIDGWPSGNVATMFVNGGEKLIVMLWTTPVAQNKTIVHALFLLKKTGKLWLDIPYYLLLNRQSRINTAQDIEIWNTGKPEAGRVYVKHDLLTLKYREFYQHWVDKVI